MINEFEILLTVVKLNKCRYCIKPLGSLKKQKCKHVTVKSKPKSEGRKESCTTTLCVHYPISVQVRIGSENGQL